MKNKKRNIFKNHTDSKLLNHTVYSTHTRMYQHMDFLIDLFKKLRFPASCGHRGKPGNDIHFEIEMRCWQTIFDFVPQVTNITHTLKTARLSICHTALSEESLLSSFEWLIDFLFYFCILLMSVFKVKEMTNDISQYVL